MKRYQYQKARTSVKKVDVIDQITRDMDEKTGRGMQYDFKYN